MLMTKEQAETVWCPKARRGDVDVSTFNRTDGGRAAPTCTCLTTGCMAWRWYDASPRGRQKCSFDHETTAEPSRPSHIPASWPWVPATDDTEGWCGWLEPEEEAVTRIHDFNAKERRGFCGAFSKPEMFV